MTLRFKAVTRIKSKFFVYFSFLIKLLLLLILVALSISLITVLVNSFIFNQLYRQKNLSEQMAGIHKDQKGTLELQKKIFESNNNISKNKISVLFWLLLIQFSKLKKTKKVRSNIFFMINIVLVLTFFRFFYILAYFNQIQFHKELKNCQKFSFFLINSLKVSNEISNF